MAQFARPSADLVTHAEWTETPYWSKIDDAGDAGADSVVIQNATPTTADIIAVDLTSVTDPEASTGHIIRARFQKVAGAGTLRLTVQLRQGYVDEGTQGSLIATGLFDEGDAEVFETYTLTLSGTEADSITDYTDLQYRVWAARDTGATGRPIDVEYVEFEVPDAAGGASHERAGASSVAVTTSASGFKDAFGSGASSVAVTSAGSGFKEAFGSGSTSVVVTTAASGVVVKFGAGASSVTVTTAGSGQREAVGAGATTVVVSTSASGFKTAFASGATTVVVTTSASGSVVVVTEHPPGPATAPTNTGTSTINTTPTRLDAVLAALGVSATTVSTGMSTAPVSDSSSEAE
jgi:hypothetical protein